MNYMTIVLSRMLSQARVLLWMLIGLCIQSVGMYSSYAQQTFVVTNGTDGPNPGPEGSLRRAVYEANFWPGQDNIIINCSDILLTSGSLIVTEGVSVSSGELPSEHLFNYWALYADDPLSDTIWTIQAGNMVEIMGLNMFDAKIGLYIEGNGNFITYNKISNCRTGIYIKGQNNSIINNAFGFAKPYPHSSYAAIEPNGTAVADYSSGFNSMFGNYFAASSETEIYIGATAREDGVYGNYFGFNNPSIQSDTVFSYKALTIYGQATNIGGKRDGSYINPNVFASYMSYGEVYSDSNVIMGNMFGLQHDGQTPAPFLAAGLTIYGDDNLIGHHTRPGRNVFGSGENASALLLIQAHRNTIIGNYFGTDSTGLSAGLLNRGIQLVSGSSENIIGGATVGERNIFSTTQVDIYVQDGTANHILGNYFGLNADGSATLVRGGIGVDNASPGLIVGDGSDDGRNYFVNKSTAINTYTSSRATEVQNNVFGLMPDGVTVEPNNTALVLSGNASVIDDNIFAGTNAGRAIQVFADSCFLSGNIIGVDVLGNGPKGFNIALEINGENNRIGSRTSGEGNSISWSTQLISIGSGANQNHIEGNAIGLGIENQIRGGGHGISVNQARGNTIAYNKIGSIVNAINLSNTYNTHIHHNAIGVADSLGSIQRGNSGVGISITSNTSGTLIEHNTIAYNNISGISIVDAESDSNRWYWNRIYENKSGITRPSNSKNSVTPPHIMGGIANVGVWGKAQPGSRVELFLDEPGKIQASDIIGGTYADAQGTWAISVPGLSEGQTLAATQDSAFNSSLWSTRYIPSSAGNILERDHGYRAVISLGSIKAFDSISVPLRFYADDGSVISQIAMHSGDEFSWDGKNADTLDHSYPDTLIGWVKFKPESEGVFSDTLRVVYDSRVFALTLEGVATEPSVLTSEELQYSFPNTRVTYVSNRQVELYAPKAPLNVTAIRLARAGTSGYSFDGSSLPYSIDSDTLRVGVHFTPSAIGVSLDTLIFSHDGYQRELRIPLQGLGLENQAPVVHTGLLRSTVLKDRIEFYAVSDEPLSSVSLKINNTTVPLQIVPAHTRMYRAEYEITADGELAFEVTANDTILNQAIALKTYVIADLGSGSTSVLRSGQAEMRILKSSARAEGYLILSEISSDNDLTNNGSNILQTCEILSTASQSWSSELSFNIAPAHRSDWNLTIPGFSTKHLKITRLDATGGWERRMIAHADENRVYTSINESGRYALVYDPSFSEIPKSLDLAQNYPNPFNPSTSIRFGLANDGYVRIAVYNVLGQKIRNLISEQRTAGYHNVMWDGKNQKGSAVPSGIYIYRLETVDGILSKKMVLLK